MGKPTKNSDPEFSAEEITKFWTWYHSQEDFIKELFKDGAMVVNGLRNQQAGRDPLDDGGPPMSALYAAPFC